MVGAVHASFRDDSPEARDVGIRPALMASGELILVAAYDTDGRVVGGGSAAPRGTAAELMGIGVVGPARGQGHGTAITQALVEAVGRLGVETAFLSAGSDQAASIYRAVGFEKVGTAMILEVHGTEVLMLEGDEWPVWRDLRLRSLADSPDAFGSTLEREDAFTEDDWRDRLQSMPVVAFVDGRPVAMGGGYRVRAGWVQVVAMWTDPAYRGRGLARQVLDTIVKTARSENRGLVLDVARGNSPARTAYEHYGFVPTGESSPLRDGSDIVIDQLVLPD